MKENVQELVVERMLPWTHELIFSGVFLIAVAVALQSGAIASAATRAAAHLPWVEATLFGWIVYAVCFGAAAAVFVGAVVWAMRRYGRAVITRDHVVITPIRRGLGPIVIPRDDVVAIRETASGLVLSAPAARSHLRALLLPAFMPVREVDLARAHALLDPARRVRSPGVSASLEAATNVTHAWLGLPIVLLVAVALWAATTAPLETLVQVVAAALALVVGVVASRPERSRVQLGEAAVSVGALCDTWTSVARVAAWNGCFALTLVDGRRAVARVGAEAVGRLVSIANARLAALGRRDVLETRAPVWVKRSHFMQVAALALLLALYAEAGPVRALTREGCVGIVDHHGYRVRLVYGARDAAARLVVIVDPGVESVSVRAGGARSAFFSDEGVAAERADVLVDVRRRIARWRGREHALPGGVTAVHVREDGVTASTMALPVRTALWAVGAEQQPPASTVMQLNLGLDLLERWFPETEHQLLRSVLDGRTTVRCFADGSDGWVFAQVRHGEVAAVTLVPAGRSPVQVGLQPCRTCSYTGATPGLCLKTTSAGDLEAPLPTLEQVLETQRFLRRGVAVNDTPIGRAAWRSR